MTIKTAYHASTGRHWWIVRAGRACVSSDGALFPAIAAARLGIKKAGVPPPACVS
jgi:hypothetical protein